MNRNEGTKFIENTRIIAIIRDILWKDIRNVTEALFQGGIRAVEITMNTAGAANMIAALQQDYGHQMYIGAGTVIDLSDAKEASAAGAAFFVSPNTDNEVIHYAVEHDIPAYPGAMTPTEIVTAWKAGASAVKIFPCGSAGLPYFKELLGPLRHIPMIAVGGISALNLTGYLQAGCYAVGVGSSLINRSEVAKGNFSWIEQEARQLSACVQEAGAIHPTL